MNQRLVKKDHCTTVFIILVHLVTDCFIQVFWALWSRCSIASWHYCCIDHYHVFKDSIVVYSLLQTVDNKISCLFSLTRSSQDDYSSNFRNDLLMLATNWVILMHITMSLSQGLLEEDSCIQAEWWSCKLPTSAEMSNNFCYSNSWKEMIHNC